MEFRDLIKSIFYNLALLYKEKGNHRSALRNCIEYNRIEKKNLSVILDISILCLKLLLLKESLFYFNSLIQLDTSLTMQSIYLEHVVLILFALEKWKECLQQIRILKSRNYKEAEVLRLEEYINSQLSQRDRKNDFFSEEYQDSGDGVNSILSGR